MEKGTQLIFLVKLAPLKFYKVMKRFFRKRKRLHRADVLFKFRLDYKKSPSVHLRVNTLILDLIFMFIKLNLLI